MKLNFKILICIALMYSCNATKNIKDGSLAYKLKKYELAKKLLEEEIESPKAKNKLKKILELAESYRYSNEPINAARWYEKAIEKGAKNTVLFDLAMMQKQNEEYEKAIETLERYKDISFDNYRTKPELAICRKAIAELEKPNNMSVQNLTEINSAQSDFGTTLYKNNTIIITSSRPSAKGDAIHPWTGEKNSDLFVVDPKTNQVYPLDSTINTLLPEANICFNKDYTIAYFTRCDFPAENNESGYCYIYKVEKDGQSWYEPEKLELFADTINVGQAFLSPDGKKLYFSSDAPSGYGGRDIFFANIKNGEVGFPINLGYTVNTEKDELFPTLDSKGNLYYSTNGRTGYGGLDIFKAIPAKKGFDESFQMPYPVNSGADDFGFVLYKEFNGVATDGIVEEGYFSSSRKGGKGNDDIYFYQKEIYNVFSLELICEEKYFENQEDDNSTFLGMKALAKAKVSLIDLSNNEKKEAISDLTGKVYFDLNAETDYRVLVSKKDYFNQSIKISTKNIKELTKVIVTLRDTVELEKIFPEKEIVINNIYYDLDKAVLRPESLPELDKLIQFFKENNDLTIEIGSHTDSRGSDEYNLDLSQKRAQSVVNYLLSKGITAKQLIAKGYGETKILNGCTNDVECSEEEHQENRRTSFRVVSSEGILESN